MALFRSDQGTMFMSKFTARLCKLLDIQKIKTNPWHPQTNGVLERWHSSLNGMMKRAEKAKTEWDKLLKFLLFAYCTMPHSVTGFPPADLLYGNMYGDLLISSGGSG